MQQPSTQPDRPPTDVQETIRILMVDDSPVMCLIVRSLLSSLKGVDFVWCNDPTKALETARACQPSVILQDVDMPGLSGYDLLRLYRKTFETRSVPVVMHTARHEPKDKARAFSLGASDYLVKNEDPEELKARLHYHAQRYQRLRMEASGTAGVTTIRHEIKVLLVDSSRFTALMLKNALEQEEHITFRQCSGEEAIEAAGEFLPTVILLGLTPGDPGVVDRLRSFREHGSTREVPVIVLATRDEPGLVRQLLSQGASDVVEKSRDLVELVSRIRSKSNDYYAMLQARIDPAAGEVREDERIRILMIDDSKSACLRLKAQLSSEPTIEFEFVLDPGQALARARKFQPTVVLLDMVMPGVDGLDLLQELREESVTSDVPIIILSGVDKATVKGKAFALGANDYINKDVDKIELLSRVQYHSRAWRNSREVEKLLHGTLEANRKIDLQARKLEENRNFIRKTFGRYLSDDIVDNLLDSPDGLELGGEKRVLTVMMTDLRGFTSMGERLGAEQVIRVVNNYLEVMTEIIMRYGGTIDEFIGDAILAMFGAPKRDDDHPTKAVACAIEMQRAMRLVNDRNVAAGLPVVEMGIGLNTGEVVVGNIGSQKRAKYGVVGRHVNIAGRIEAKTSGGQILISEWTRALVGDILEIRSEDSVEMKGVEKPLTIYDVAGIGGAYDLHLDAEETATHRLSVPLEVRVRLIGPDKSKLPGQYAGTLVALGRKRAELVMRADLEPSGAIEMRLVESRATAEAKVMAGRDEPGAPWRVRITSKDERFDALVSQVLAEGAATP